MDSFQGSTPLNFISFCLENQTPETENLPDSSVTFQYAANEVTGLDTANTVDLLTSPWSADSEPDINVYAEAMMHSMESERLLVEEGLTTIVAEGEPKSPESSEIIQGPQHLVPARSSTPIPVDDEGASNSSLDALESTRVATAKGSPLPELLSTSQLDAESSATTVPQTDDYNESFVYEVPAFLAMNLRSGFLLI